MPAEGLPELCAGFLWLNYTIYGNKLCKDDYFWKMWVLGAFNAAVWPLDDTTQASERKREREVRLRG